MFVNFVTIALSTGYGPSGDTYTAAKLGLSQVDLLSCDPVTPTAAIAAISVDNTNKKLRAWGSIDTVAEVGANTDNHTITARCIAYGR